MAEAYVGEIKQFAGNFAPSGWAFCNGAIQSIADNTTLFTLIGTTYGGDGINTFALPDLRSRVPIHQGNSSQGNYVIGQQSGSENVTITAQQVPSHTHTPLSSSANGTSSSPAGGVWATTNNNSLIYGAAPGTANMNAASIQPTGGSQSHTNLMPYQAINYIISLYGIFPSRN